MLWLLTRWFLSSGIGISLLALILKLLNEFWWKPTTISEQLKAQGFDGPPYKVFGLGNGVEIVRLLRAARSLSFSLSNDILPIAFPYYHLWSNIYGRKLMFWFGTTPVICVDDPVTAKELLMNKHGDFGMMKLPDSVRQILGNGLIDLDGEKWARHRKIANPAFSLENLKEMVSCINHKANQMVQRWADEKKVEADAFKEFKDLTADIIGATAFGSNPQQAKNVIKLLDEQTAIGIEEYSFLPGYKFLPTKRKKRRTHLATEIRKCLREMVEERRAKQQHGQDFLGSMLEANEKASVTEGLSIQEIVDECKAFFFSGHETTAGMLSWTALLLATNPEWQERAREEANSVLGKEGHANWADMSKLKILGTVFYESLRLYPPAVGMIRKSLRDSELAGIRIPKGTQVMIPLLAMNHDNGRWGDDVAEFNPNRFSECGGGKVDKSFMPFGYGPRTCIGQNLALLEAKIAMATILRRFSFSLSPFYSHSPVVFITMYPQHGIPILLHPV
ncbi:cytochrome P450 734A1-like [Aristolochia californica]|uniref:cytochrome P450 734A1-like n=1 Tax=Aristolochia californica TaxID=171875 RepID=UPI0035DD0535